MSKFSERSGKFDLSFIESYNSRLALGGQFVIDNDNGRLKPQVGLAARYSIDNTVYAMTIACRTLHLSLWQQINDRLQFATKLEYDEKNRNFHSCLIYQLEYPDSCIRGQFSSDFSVGFTYNRLVYSSVCFTFLRFGLRNVFFLFSLQTVYAVKLGI